VTPNPDTREERAPTYGLALRLDRAERRVQELEEALANERKTLLRPFGPPTDEEVERAAWSLCSHFAEPGAEVVFDAPGDSPAWRAIARAALEAARKR
jgi:hypothetical protein